MLASGRCRLCRAALGRDAPKRPIQDRLPLGEARKRHKSSGRVSTCGPPLSSHSMQSGLSACPLATKLQRTATLLAGQKVNDTGTAGVIARPPVLFLAALLFGLASDRLLALPFAVPGTDLVQCTTAASMILVGMALFAAGVRSFLRAATPCPR